MQKCVYKCPFQYWGSKARMCAKIIETSREFLKNKKYIISPFCGSAVTELNFAHQFPNTQVICYDTNPHVINFHNQAQQHPRALQTKMNQHLKRPIDSEFYTHVFDRMQAKTVQDAADWWLCTLLSFNGKVTRSSYSKKKFGADNKKFPQSKTLQTYPPNIKFIYADSLEALEALPTARWKHVFMYLDPPYVQKSARAYIWGNKAATSTDDFDHARLAALLTNAAASGATWILSYGKNPMVTTLYRSFRKIPIKMFTHSWIRDKKESKTIQMTELLVTSQPNPRLKENAVAAKPPTKTPAKTPKKTPAKTPAKTPTKTPAKTQKKAPITKKKP
jgi:site-specific DNA-adenine methylase